MSYTESRVQVAQREIWICLGAMLLLTVVNTWLALAGTDDDLIILFGTLAVLSLLGGFSAFLRRERAAEGGLFKLSNDEAFLHFWILVLLAGFVSLVTCGVYALGAGGMERFVVVVAISYIVTVAPMCIMVAIKLPGDDPNLKHKETS